MLLPLRHVIRKAELQLRGPRAARNEQWLHAMAPGHPPRHGPILGLAELVTQAEELQGPRLVRVEDLAPGLQLAQVEVVTALMRLDNGRCLLLVLLLELLCVRAGVGLRPGVVLREGF